MAKPNGAVTHTLEPYPAQLRPVIADESISQALSRLFVFGLSTSSSEYTQLIANFADFLVCDALGKA